MKIEMEISPQGQIAAFSIDGTACDIIPRVAPPVPGPGPNPPPSSDKLPKLEGDQFDRMVRLQRSGQYDAVLAAELGEQYNQYVAAYGPGNYYWGDVLNAALTP